MNPRKRIPCAKPAFAETGQILQDMERVLFTGRLMLGPYLERFEREFADYVGTRHAIGVNSCTTALEITLRYLDLDGAEVVVPTNTFIATANAVIYAGGKPRLVDVNPENLCLDVDILRKALTENTRAVIVVHLGGIVSPDMEEVRGLCEQRGIALTEDCAHAHGATFEGRKAGTFGMAGCFSFYPTKIMTTGTGGMITTDDDGLNEFARSVRLHGRGVGDRDGLDAIIHLGNDWFLDEVHSVLGLHQLRGLEEALAARRSLVERYRELLQNVHGVKPIVLDGSSKPSYYKFMVLIELPVSVPTLKQRLLEEHGIETESLYWPPCHLPPIYRRLFGTHEGMFPVAEEALSKQLCLPLYPGMSLEDVDYVVSCLESELTGPVQRDRRTEL